MPRRDRWPAVNVGDRGADPCQRRMPGQQRRCLHANRFVDLDQTRSSSMVKPALASALRVAGTGLRPMVRGSRLPRPRLTTRPVAAAPARAPCRAEVSSSGRRAGVDAAAVCRRHRAVFAKAGRSFASCSTLVSSSTSPAGVSPVAGMLGVVHRRARRPLALWISTGTISSRKRPLRWRLWPAAGFRQRRRPARRAAARRPAPRPRRSSGRRCSAGGPSAPAEHRCPAQPDWGSASPASCRKRSGCPTDSRARPWATRKRAAHDYDTAGDEYVASPALDARVLHLVDRPFSPDSTQPVERHRRHAFLRQTGQQRRHARHVGCYPRRPGWRSPG